MPPPIEVRPAAGRAGAELSLALWNAVHPDDRLAPEDVLSYREAVGEHLDVVAVLDGEPAGSGFVAVEPHQRGSGRARAEIAVAGERRRRGAGTALWEALSVWAAARGARELEARVYDDDPDGAAFAARRGYVEVLREARVALELAGVAPPAIDPPAGIEIVAWAQRPGCERGLYAVAREAYPDVPGSEEEAVEPFEDWLAHDMRGPGDRPEATFVALAGDEVVGYAKLSLTSAQPAVAHHDLTGVRRAWRGRGIAGALKRAQIAWAKERGYERLVTANELRNAPIRRLNERFGYAPIPGRALVRGPIAPGS